MKRVLPRRLIPSFVLALVTGLAGVWAFAVPPGTSEEISARIQPFGSVCRAGDDCASAVATASSGPMSGQQVYDKFCFACHATGVGGAPLFGDADGWAPRVAKGMDALMTTTLNGINAMPAKGTCMSCSDDELGEAVTYMLDNAK